MSPPFPPERQAERPTTTAADLGQRSRNRGRSAIIRIVTSVLVVAVLAAFLVAVATNRLPHSATSSSGPVKGGSIVDGLFLDPDSLLPNFTRSFSGFAAQVDQAIWAPLWYGDPQGIFHSGLAREVPSPTNGGISPDLMTWTIRLRPGLKWSDGSPLTADDCAFTFNLLADPAVGSGFPTTDPADPIGFAGAAATDPQTVILTFKHPFLLVLSWFADGLGSCLPREVFESIRPADVASSPENFQPTVTSGPFTVKERVENDHLTVVRNPYYYQAPAKPYLDQITFKLFGDSTALDPNPLLTALQTHTADTSWFLDPTMLASYRAIAGYTTYLDRYPDGYEVLVFNLSDPLMSDHAVRQAFTMGVDLNTLISTILDGAAKLTCDDHAGTFAHEESLVPCYHYDPTAAGQVLDSDVWVMGADGYRHKNGQILELEYATTARFPRGPTQALIRDELARIGMKIDLKVYDEGDFFGVGSNKVLDGDHFQIAEYANGGGYDPDDGSFLASVQTPDRGGSNYMHYANPEVDAQERVQQSTADITARKAAFHIIHQDVLKDLPVMYLYVAQNVACARSDLHNYDPSALGASETWNVWDWWLGAKGG